MLGCNLHLYNKSKSANKQFRSERKHLLFDVFAYDFSFWSFGVSCVYILPALLSLLLLFVLYTLTVKRFI